MLLLDIFLFIPMFDNSHVGCYGCPSGQYYTCDYVVDNPGHGYCMNCVPNFFGNNYIFFKYIFPIVYPILLGLICVICKKKKVIECITED
jgi:hypothetical protein